MGRDGPSRTPVEGASGQSVEDRAQFVDTKARQEARCGIGRRTEQEFDLEAPPLEVDMRYLGQQGLPA
jgi:hypothetical protein